ncbi:hypothetical protein E2P81_ATG02014 [Venturia nashicola]|nr:hypothetical protein E2P81_ATG02014 [Venturia nashicola]
MAILLPSTQNLLPFVEVFPENLKRPYVLETAYQPTERHYEHHRRPKTPYTVATARKAQFLSTGAIPECLQRPYTLYTAFLIC